MNKASTIFICASVISLAACANSPAEKKTVDVFAYGPLKGAPADGAYGYSEEKVSNDKFLVRYDGRYEQTYEQLRTLLLRRASELCWGSFNFTGYTLETGFVANAKVGSSRVDLQACKLEYSIVSPK